MNTVQEILAKESWNEADINVLIQNVKFLPISALEKLGLAPVKVPVKVEAPKPMEPVTAPVVVAETPKKKGRPSKK